MSKKKSNNPLKMWGAWVGAILLITTYFINLGTTSCVKGLNLTNFFCSVSETLGEFGFLAMLLSIPKLFANNIFKLSGMGEIMGLPILIIAGFLIGWGIHSLIRKYK